ncbi:hypothetical protein [Nesterenkonia flava]|uniref:Uncharacterized protein n=1 Tax=Nesterenkonia flava TaxID=469799 RepID=A0ABU1FTR4_9MICC|nr:hypothetical protein [Nesterenkonia flava]MDR5712034.1 hypothetical protein [Nesterenkonia flava]
MERPHNHERPPTPWHRTEKAQRIRAQVVEHMGPVSDEKPDQGSIDIVRTMMGVCLQAHQEARPLADDDAKAIAQLLSTAVADHESRLADLAHNRGLLPGSVREELCYVLDRRNIYPETREAANWLGNWILAEEGYADFLPRVRNSFDDMDHVITQNPSRGVPALACHYRTPEPGEDAEEIAELAANRAAELLDERFYVASAHLRRPSVDVLADDYRKRMDAEYIGSRPHPHQFIHEIAAYRGYDRDDPLLRQEMAELYEMVWAGRAVHLFLRHEAATGEVGRNSTGEWEDRHAK